MQSPGVMAPRACISQQLRFARAMPRCVVAPPRLRAAVAVYCKSGKEVGLTAERAYVATSSLRHACDESVCRMLRVSLSSRRSSSTVCHLVGFSLVVCLRTDGVTPAFCPSLRQEGPKRLVLFRHAKSEWDVPEGTIDRDRPLSARGRREAAEMGRRAGPSLQIQSSKTRCTCRLLWQRGVLSRR